MAQLGMPSVIISFNEAGIAAIERSKRGCGTDFGRRSRYNQQPLPTHLPFIQLMIYLKVYQKTTEITYQMPAWLCNYAVPRKSLFAGQNRRTGNRN